MAQEKFAVRLSAEDRTQLEGLIRKGQRSARVINRARILPKTDEGWSASQVVAALDTSQRTVFGAKRWYAEEGLDGVLHDHPQANRYRKLDDRGEAHLIALACSDAPEGHDHWTLRLLADKVVALPGQLFYATQIPVCLWFLARHNGKFRDRRGEILFIDARKLGSMVDRTHRELRDEDIARIADTYHAWRGSDGAAEYAEVPGFCKSASLEEIRKHGHVLTPGRYVGAAPQPDDGEPFQEKMTRLTAQWREQQAEAGRLDAVIAKNLERLGLG